jgi:hypothetical protein
MRLLREYIRNLLKEDPMGFVQDLSAAHQAGEFGENFFGGDVGKSGGKALKRSFAKNADHQWLSTLDTVHWTGGVEYLPALVGRGKDELSTSMTLPGENFAPPHKMGSRGVKTGLWVKGRITLAANDQDNMYTGDFVWRGMHGKMSDLSPEEQEQREKSSGINKLPSVSKDYSRYGQLKKGTEFGEKMAKNIPYILDQSTWDPSKQHSETNEALVDNWRPVGIIVVEEDVLDSLNIFGDTPSESIGVVKELFRTATEFGVPIYDPDRNKVWSPGEKEVKEESVRKYVRSLLSEDMPARQAFAQELRDDPEWDPQFQAERSSDPEKEKETYKQTFKVGRKLKTLFAKYADRAFLDNLVTVHWGDSNRILDIFQNASSRDELSTSVYLPGEVGSSIWGRGTGLVVKGHITILSNHMNDLMTGKGEVVKAADPERAKMSGANKGVGRGHHPDTYEMGTSLLVFDEEDWSPELAGGTHTNNEALVDNWKPVGIIAPAEKIDMFKWVIKKKNLDIPVVTMEEAEELL